MCPCLWGLGGPYGKRVSPSPSADTKLGRVTVLHLFLYNSIMTYSEILFKNGVHRKSKVLGDCGCGEPLGVRCLDPDTSWGLGGTQETHSAGSPLPLESGDSNLDLAIHTRGLPSDLYSTRRAGGAAGQVSSLSHRLSPRPAPEPAGTSSSVL